jgi:uncharacterized protein with ParB-like and HNH nuclease domain
LSIEFLKNWKQGDSTEKVRLYDPYFMGEIVLSTNSESRSCIIDGQQRITTFTLLLIYLVKKYGHLEKFPTSDIEKAIYSDDYGTLRFNLDIKERKNCMLSLYKYGTYIPTDEDRMHVQNIVDRYGDIEECWNDKIDETNVVNFAYWIKEKIIFSKVWTNNDEFAYVIFETMNDRGLSLTQVEMLRSYLLANINKEERDSAISIFDNVIKTLVSIKLSSKSKAEFEFFKVFFRGHYAEDFSQTKDSNSDFVKIGKEFHRWIRDKSTNIGLKESHDFVTFVSKISYFAKQYEKINSIILGRNVDEYLYLIVNSDYGFTLQPALILSSIAFNDDEKTVDEKIKLVSKYLTKVLSWRVWNHIMISQSSMENSIYMLCKKIRGADLETLKNILDNEPIDLPRLEYAPILNQQNKPKIKVLLELITAIVSKESNSLEYILNKQDIEVEHIWADHFEHHKQEFDDINSFASARNNIGDLLLLPKSFNASYNDAPYSEKVEQYFEQNILAQTLNKQKYVNNPDFLRFVKNSELPFRSYEEFNNSAINERAELYKKILLWNWQNK